MLKHQAPELLRNKIVDAPHWRVLIRPGAFKEERVESLSECWRLISSCRVSLRGWDYPHIGPNNENNGDNWIESWDEFEAHREYWRFYQSGQFVHLFSFKEDSYRDKAEAKARSDTPALENAHPSGYLGVISTLWTITEIFEFASRIVQKANFGDSVSIIIQMNSVQNRVLYESELSRDLYRLYMASQPVLSKEQTISTRDLLSRSSDYSLDTAVWFFERFQLMNVPRQVWAEDQRRLLERQF